MERIVALGRGDKGDRGAQGAKGDRGDRGRGGMTGAQRKAFTYLALVVLVYCGLLGFGLIHYVRQNAQERCASIEQTTRIPVPHPIAGNPSRIWEARYEAIERQRARQLGCR